MKILLLNQAFIPDCVSSAHYAADVVAALVSCGHEVTVVASRRAYDSPATLFPSSERSERMNVIRVRSTGFGKSARWRRAADFFTFLSSCALQLLRVERPDVVVAMTSPPLLSVLASLFCMTRRCALVYWVLDLNPDEAIALGWLRANSFTARVLERLSRLSLACSTQIVALDRFMEERLIKKGVPRNKISVLPPWSHTRHVRYDSEGSQAFRNKHGLTGKFVVMHSGNHSPCHPLDTLLAAAERLKTKPDISFCFVGGGSQMSKVREFAAREQLSNIVCLSYQPFDQLSASLSSADLHVVVMGTELIGIVHPSKVYNILSLSIPILYIGPAPSHVSELADGQLRAEWLLAAHHGEVDAVVAHILAASKTRIPRSAGQSAVAEAFRYEALTPRMVSIIEQSATRQTLGRQSAAEHA